MEGGGMGVNSGVQPVTSWETALADKVAQLALNHGSDLPAVGGEAPGEAGAQHVLPAEASGVVVDHALRDALSHPKNRAAVLKLEEEVEAFVLDSQDPQYVFSRDMTSYERLLAHRTAQHWGLETTTISQGPDQGKIVAYRAAFTQMPKVRLADLPVTMTDLPPPAPSASPASPAPAPRVLVRKRPERLGPRGGPGGDMHHSGGGSGGMGPFPDGAGPGGFRSVEERQAEYHRARARIFGGGPGAPGGVPMDGAYNMAQPIPLPHRGQLYGAGGLPTSPGGSPFPMSPPRAVPGAGFTRPAGGWGGGGMGGSGGGNNGGGGRKAVLRNKHEDLNDPDFRRQRHSGPRFDPGFGEELESQRSMYVRPTYSSEFPELGGHPSPSSSRGRGGGGGGRGAQQSPRRGGPMHSPMAGGGMPMAGGVGSPGGMYGGWQPMGPAGQMHGMMAAGPMGPFMVPPGMVMAGPMPGMGAGMVAYSPGGTAMSFHPTAAGYYPMPPYGYYPMQPGAAGGVQEGMHYAMPYSAAAYPGMGSPGAAAAMGGFPGGPAAAAAMAAMASPMPMPLSPQHSSQMHPGGGISRQRSNGVRSRGSGGGASGGHSSGSTPQALGSLPDASQHAGHPQHAQQEGQHAGQGAVRQDGHEQQSAQQAEAEAAAAGQQ